MKKHSFLAGMLTMALIISLGFSALAATGSFTITVDPVNIQVNGTTFAPKDAKGNNVPVFAYGGTTYAPLRALAEAYGLEVGYDAGSNMATVGEPLANNTTNAHIVQNGAMWCYAKYQTIPAIDHLFDESNPQATLSSGDSYGTTLYVYEYKAQSASVASKLVSDYINLLKNNGFQATQADYRVVSKDKAYEIVIPTDGANILVNVISNQLATPQTPSTTQKTAAQLRAEENDRHNAAIEELESQYDSYEQIINDKISAIRSATTPYSGSDSSYESKQSSLLSDISKLQSKIDELRPDDSREAQAQLRVAASEMADKQQELSNLQEAYSAKSQLDALDGSLRDFKQRNNADIAEENRLHRDILSEIGY